jgi:multicomponent Na+:H+ antiporter subunit E
MPELRLPTGSRARRLWALQTFVLLLLTWLALDGVAALSIGIVFAALGAALGSWLVPGEPYPWRPLRLLRFVRYFLLASFRGGIDVAWRALHPRLPIAPCYLDYHCSLPQGLPRTVFISVISLLPGTLSVESYPDGRVHVHALGIDGAMEGLRELEAYVRVLFSLEHASVEEALRP